MFRSCIVGSRAVDWLMAHESESGAVCKTEEHAMALGDAMLTLGMLHRVAHEERFRHAHLLYRYVNPGLLCFLKISGTHFAIAQAG